MPEGTEPLSKRQRLKRLVHTEHHYPLPLKDALSVHVEVRSDEPEIEVGRRRVVELAPSGELGPVHGMFSHKLEPTARLIHRYSSKRPPEGREPEAEALLVNSLFLETRIVLAPNIRAAYSVAAAAFGAAAIFVSYVCWRGIADGSTAGLIGEALTTGALATGLALWLITTQYRVRIIHRKLFWARPALYVSISLIVLSLIAYGTSTLFGPSPSKENRCPTCRQPIPVPIQARAGYESVERGSSGSFDKPWHGSTPSSSLSSIRARTPIRPASPGPAYVLIGPPRSRTGQRPTGSLTHGGRDIALLPLT